MSSKSENFFDSKVLWTSVGIVRAFLTEMWERFSFYGMRVLLIQFLTAAVIGLNPGWEWSYRKSNRFIWNIRNVT